jgi:hypothetical protein
MHSIDEMMNGKMPVNDWLTLNLTFMSRRALEVLIKDRIQI